MLAAGSTYTVRSSPGACIVAVFFSNRDANFTLHRTHRCMGRQCWCRCTSLPSLHSATNTAGLALLRTWLLSHAKSHDGDDCSRIRTTLWSLTVAGCMLFVTGGNDSVLFRAFTHASNVTVFMAAALCLCSSEIPLQLAFSCRTVPCITLERLFNPVR